MIPSNDDSKNLFYILQNGSIVLNESLSYNNKSAFYQLQLKACVSARVTRARGLRVVALAHRRPSRPQDSGGEWNNSQVTLCSQPVFLSISVVDEPDLDPQFVREFYSASVAEDAALVCAGDCEGAG